MKSNSFIILIISILVHGSCTPKIMSFYVVDENRLEVNTFSFYGEDNDYQISKKVELDSLIEMAINDQLKINGYKYNYPSDFYITYKVISDKTIEVDNNYNSHNNNYANQALNRNYYTKEQKEGVFMIEFFDEHDKLIWQGSREFNVNKSADTKMLFMEFAAQIVNSFKSNL